MKHRINLIGGGFQHVKSTTIDKEPHTLIWDYNSEANEISIYVDNAILTAPNDGKIKYGWILESRAVIPGLISEIKKDPAKYIEPFKYIFTHYKDILEIDEKFKWSPANGTWIRNIELRDKTKLVSMISSNKKGTKLQKYRYKLAKKWQKKVDLFGIGFNPILHKEEGLNDYMFSIAIENDCYNGYFTEKILDCFAVGTIPVYMGAPDISDHFNADGVILLDKKFKLKNLSPELYYSKMDAVKENMERVKEFDILDDWIYEKFIKS